jgi:BRCT domain type II-containing protein
MQNKDTSEELPPEAVAAQKMVEVLLKKLPKGTGVMVAIQLSDPHKGALLTTMDDDETLSLVGSLLLKKASPECLHGLKIAVTARLAALN